MDAKEKVGIRIYAQFILLLISLNCLAQDDINRDDLLALVKPINISYFKDNGFRKLEISYYTIQSHDTVIDKSTKYFELIHDSVLKVVETRVKGEASTGRYYKEDMFGHLYPASLLGVREFPNRYVINEKKQPVLSKSTIGRQYFYYDEAGRLIRSASDTFELVTNRPCNLIQYSYSGNQLIQKTSSVFNAGNNVPITSDTLQYKYDSANRVCEYLFTNNSSSSFRGETKIIYRNSGQVIDLVQPNKKRLVRYSFQM